MAMSMRSRGAAAAGRRARPGARPVYEDFKPVTDLIHEEGADILLYQLPGFVKEQIRIIAESKGLLRVRGERVVADNKWSRFQEDIAVPEDCNLSEIRAKFEDGILRIIMPKIKKMETRQHIIEKEANSPPTLTPSSIHQNPQVENISNNPQPLIPSKAASESRADPTNTDSNEARSKGVSTISNKINEIKEKGVSTISNKINEIKEKHRMVANDDNHYKSKSNLKNLTKVSRKLDEDGQLLVNMGVAILVIMALGASISYSLGFNNQIN